MRTNPSTTPPVVQELRKIFASLPDKNLLKLLRKPYWRGRPPYQPIVLWHITIAMYAMNIESVLAMVRLLHDNRSIAECCGCQERIPSQPTLSRFLTLLSRGRFKRPLREVHRQLTRELKLRLPNFGRTVAIDSTTLKGWSNPIRKTKSGHASDPDAAWAVKKNTRGSTEYTFGFKAHILCDAVYELPIACDVAPGNVHDVRLATPLLRQARLTMKFQPRYVLADKGYSSKKLRQAIRQHYWATPVIHPNPGHKSAVREIERLLPNWRAIYRQRASVERLNGRLKGFFRLNSIRVRGIQKVRVHMFLSILTLQARALAFPATPRHCVRPV